MIYPELEARNAKIAAKRKKREVQAELYFNSGSFDEYVLKCAATGINRKYWLFGMLDPFGIHYAVKNKGMIKLQVFLSVPLMLMLDIAVSVICRLCGFQTWTSAVGGGTAGAFCYYMCGLFLKCCFEYADSFKYDMP